MNICKQFKKLSAFALQVVCVDGTSVIYRMVATFVADRQYESNLNDLGTIRKLFKNI